MTEGNRTIEQRLLPVWLARREGVTARRWKARKRREMKSVLKAFDAFRMGCAYTPLKDGEVGRIDTLLKSCIRQLSAKEWGR